MAGRAAGHCGLVEHGGPAVGVATDPPIPRELILVTPLDREPSPAGAAFLHLLDDDGDHSGGAAAAITLPQP